MSSEDLCDMFAVLVRVLVLLVGDGCVGVLGGFAGLLLLVVVVTSFCCCCSCSNYYCCDGGVMVR